MANLSDFKRGKIVDARMVGASVTETSQMFDVSRSTVSKVKTAFEREGKTSSTKNRSGRKSKLSERPSVPKSNCEGQSKDNNC
jgi:transposase